MDEIIDKKWEFKSGGVNSSLPWKRVNIKLSDKGVTFFKNQKIHLFIKFTDIKDIYLEKRVVGKFEPRTVLDIVDNENCIYSTFLYNLREIDSIKSRERTQGLKLSLEKAIYHKGEHYLKFKSNHDFINSI